MTSRKVGRAELSKAVNGDLAAFAVLLTEPQHAIQKASSKLPPLVLTPEAVRTVLVALQRHDVSPELVQRWASLMRWGLIPHTSNELANPIDIRFDPSREDELVEIVARLDELGALVDGDLSTDEISALLRTLDQ